MRRFVNLRAAPLSRRTEVSQRMASIAGKTSHQERTAAEPRDKSLHTVILDRIDQINDSIRLFRLKIPGDGPSLSFLPGQWLDVFTPETPKAGGFTITSPPSRARPTPDGRPGYLELAVQRSPENPPAAWLWRDRGSILGRDIRVRVGGSFVWPPTGIDAQSLKRVVFIAGGVGINPLISMLSSIAETQDMKRVDLEVQFLYSMKDPGGARDAGRMLFLERLASVFGERRVKGELKLFLTGGREESGVIRSGSHCISFQGRRVTTADLEAAVGPLDERMATAVYVCGVPLMTDGFVEQLTKPAPQGLGLMPHMVLCEKWW